MSEHRDVIVSKPWGYEYLVYESSEVALWLLYIKQGQGTSLHCHPKKTTGLILLSGEAELRFLADSKIIKAPEKEMLRRGLFHSTHALSPDGVFLFEIETPNDKDDLVRLSDDYGRSSIGYETKSQQTPKDPSCLWISEPADLEAVKYQFKKISFEVQRVEDLNFLEIMNDTDILMFLRGGVGKEVSGRRHLATVPGDIGRADVVRKVAEQMEFVEEGTLILRVGA